MDVSSIAIGSAPQGPGVLKVVRVAGAAAYYTKGYGKEIDLSNCARRDIIVETGGRKLAYTLLPVNQRSSISNSHSWQKVHAATALLTIDAMIRCFKVQLF